jgi:tetratricopeptide (TPR) repeat protein
LAGALNDLGTAEARQERFDLALAHFHEAAGWKSDLPGLMRNTGIAASRSGNYIETIRALRPVIADNPADTVARSLLGTALFATQSYAEAAQVFTPLGDAGLQSQDLAYAWAASLVRTNKFTAAADLLKKVEQQQLTADTLVLLAQLWSQMGNYEHAIEVCHHAVELDPKVSRAHYLAGLAFLRLNRSADASPEFEKELLIAPDNFEAEYHLGFSLLQQSQNDRAVELWNKVLISNPEHPEANYELGKELLIEGHATAALPYLEAAVRLKPDFEPAHYQLQSAYRAVGRKYDADREATVYRTMKAKSRNITLPPPRTLDATAPVSK